VQFLKAVIYLPPGVDRDVWLPRALTHCERHRYEVTAVIDDPGIGWHDVWTLLATRGTDVVVISRWGHLDPTRVPRIEEVGSDKDDGEPARRPHPA
jgi:hypothetical protein